MGVELIRFDMSNTWSGTRCRVSSARRPVTSRFDQGGLLTEAITKHPYSVLLLDESKKRIPTSSTIMLQVMDHGTSPTTTAARRISATWWSS